MSFVQKYFFNRILIQIFSGFLAKQSTSSFFISIRFFALNVRNALRSRSKYTYTPRLSTLVNVSASSALYS